eukprot:1189875-Prorocentrum_minimum.AAC.1
MNMWTTDGISNGRRDKTILYNSKVTKKGSEVSNARVQTESRTTARKDLKSDYADGCTHTAKPASRTSRAQRVRPINVFVDLNVGRTPCLGGRNARPRHLLDDIVVTTSTSFFTFSPLTSALICYCWAHHIDNRQAPRQPVGAVLTTCSSSAGDRADIQSYKLFVSVGLSKPGNPPPGRGSV